MHYALCNILDFRILLIGMGLRYKKYVSSWLIYETNKYKRIIKQTKNDPLEEERQTF